MGFKSFVKRVYIALKDRCGYFINPGPFHQSYEQRIGSLEKRLQWFKDHADITTLKPATGYLRKKQLDLVSFVADFFEEIEPLGIKPFLAAGSLLGFYRNAHFIPWDDDMDFDLIREDYEKLIDHFRSKGKCFIIDTKESDYMGFVDKATTANKNEYILFVYHNQIQVSKGSSVVDRLAVDFGTIDYFPEDAVFSEHKKYLSELYDMMYSPELTIREKYLSINDKLGKESFPDSDKLYFGIDNMDSYKKQFNTDWMKKDVIFPLKKVVFENREFWCARQEEEYIKFFYNDFESFPEDVGTVTHDYWDDYLKKNYRNAEFYLCDAFEIFHFMPLYNRFRANGINAWFVAEPCSENTAGDWFDYDEAVSILNKYGLRYMEKCNPDAQYAFSTQDSYILGKYSDNTIRLNMSYGCGCLKGSFGYTNRTTDGFDYRLVHGEFGKNEVRKLIPEDRVLTIGYPRHYGRKRPEKESVKKELGITSKKKILVYFPTWDEENTIAAFGDSIHQLSDEYYIVTKIHHVLDRDENFKDLKNKLMEISDIVLPGNYDFEKAACLADIALCDAKSGSSLEVPYINDKCRVVFLTNRTALDAFFDDTLEAFGFVNDAGKLKDIIKENDFDDEEQKRVISYHLGSKDHDHLETLTDMILKGQFTKRRD